MRLLQMFPRENNAVPNWQEYFSARMINEHGFALTSLDDFARGDSIDFLQQLEKKLEISDVAFFDKYISNKAFLEYLVDEVPQSQLDVAARSLAFQVNNMIYAHKQSDSIGVRNNSQQSLTDKWGLYNLGRALGIKVPRTIRLQDVWEQDIDFPVRIKPVHGYKGVSNFSLKSRNLDDMFQEIYTRLPEGEDFNMNGYVLQEEYEPLSDIRSILRFLVCGNEIIHGVIYYTKSMSCNVNGATALDSIPLTSTYNPQNDIEMQLLADYESVDIESAKLDARKVGSYGMNHGNPVFTVEFAADRDTKRVGCIDVNMGFGTNMFYPFYFEKSDFDIPTLLDGIGTKIADSYVRQIGQR